MASMRASQGIADSGGRSAPLHEQIASALRKRIREGELAAGSRLPSERSLCDDFGVSRVTVRQALKDLESEGLLQSSNGLRWVTQRPAEDAPVEEGISGLVSFADLSASRGLHVSSTVLRSLKRTCSLDEAETLGVAPGADVYELVRLRFLDRLPVVIDNSLLPLSIAPDIDTVDFTTASLYKTLANTYGCRPQRAEYAVEARGASPEHAGLLGLNSGDPVLDAWQTTFDDQSRVIQLCHMIYRGDRYRFRTLLERGGAGVELTRRTPAETLRSSPTSTSAPRATQ